MAFLSYLADRTAANPAHLVAIICPVYICPQNSIVVFLFHGYFFLKSFHQIDMEKVANCLKDFF